MRKQNILFILMLSILFFIGCKDRNIQKVSCKELLPKLDVYGFELKEIIELDKEELFEMHNGIAKQFGIVVSKNELKNKIPLSITKGTYETLSRKIVVEISRYKSAHFSQHAFNHLSKSTEENRDPGSKSNSPIQLKLYNILVNGQKGIYSKVGDDETGSIGKLTWLVGPYILSVVSKSGAMSLDEGLKIAETMK